MIRSMLAVLALAAVAGFGTDVHAQETSAFETTYKIQLRYEFWRSGGGYWETEFQTTDYEEAVTMLSLFDGALESGTIHDIFPTGFEYIITDVRMTYSYRYVAPKPVLPRPQPFKLRRP